MVRKSKRSLAGFVAFLIGCVFAFVSVGSRAEESDPALEARALELSGFRELAVVIITAEPVGAEVLLGQKRLCLVPCRLTLPPGEYDFRFRHPKRDEIEKKTKLGGGEQTRIHAVLGEKKPLKLILPTYIVGGVFTAGGVFSLVVHWDSGPEPVGSQDLTADERRFHRNLGIASIAVGVPLLVLATYLALTGRQGEVRTSVAPGAGRVDLAPMTDGEGSISGAALSVEW